jgi:acyl transferase domain-containing protein
LQKDAIIGAGQNFITAHMAHIYNFTGPNLVVDTACSSSLTAIHLAVQAIQNGEGISTPQPSPIPVPSASASKDFERPFGDRILAALIVSKIYGVIDSSAINNDGSTMGVTTPNPRAQQDLIEQAVQSAEIEPDTMTYVETHPTPQNCFSSE